MSPLESSNPAATSTEKCNITQAQDKDFKISIMNMFKDHEEDVDKWLNEDHENTVE